MTMKTIKKRMMATAAATFTGLVSGVETASAAGADGGGQGFNDILINIQNSISDIPGLVSGVAYMMGILLGVLGILKIKDHVENPGQTPLQQGAIRLACGGALFALPIVYEAMLTTMGDDGQVIEAPPISVIKFNTGD